LPRNNTLLILQCFGNSKVGSGRFESVKSIEGEEETLVVSAFRLVGRNRLLNGTTTFLADIDDTYWGWIDLYSLKNGEWIQSNIKLRTTPCDLFTTYVRKYLLGPYAETNFPISGENCMKKGEYYVKNAQAATENYPIYLPRGSVKFIIQFANLKGKSIGGYEFIFAFDQFT
ncbi:hypothetical protein KR059_008860, partial [Drosophila kikkawai]